jgi:hypothetical protein
LKFSAGPNPGWKKMPTSWSKTIAGFFSSAWIETHVSYKNRKLEAAFLAGSIQRCAAAKNFLDG